MRKVVGATRPQLASQFLAEAVVVSLIAVVGGMALAEVLLPTFNQVVRRQLDLDWLSLETGAGALTMALTVGLLSALYPARVISRYHPIRALGGSAPQFGRGRIGRGLIVLQFVMSTFLVVVTITMTRQLDFMNTNLGFDGERVVVAFSKDDLDPLQIGRVASEIDSRPGLVEGVAGIFVPPGMGGESPRPFRFGENTITIKPFRVTPDLPHVMGVEILSGTGFARDVRGPSPGILLNETAARLLGPGDPVGRVLSDPFALDEPMPVIGVVADFHYEDMRHTVGPALLAAAMPGSSRPDGFSHILFRVDNQDRPAAVEEVRTLWNRMLPEYELQDCGSSTSLRMELRDRAACRHRHEVDERMRPGHLLHGTRRTRRPRRCSPHQGNRHPQGPRGDHRQRRAAHVPPVRMARACGQRHCLAPGLLRPRSLARLLRLPDRPGPGLVRPGGCRGTRRRLGNRQWPDLAGGADQSGGCVEIRRSATRGDSDRPGSALAGSRSCSRATCTSRRAI